MRKRLVIGLSLIAGLLMAIPLLALCFGRWDSVNARTIARLKLGMTENEVETVLGRTADAEAVIAREESGQLKNYPAKQWVGLRTVRVAFDDAGKTFTIVEEVPQFLPGPFDRLRELFGF